MKRGLDSSKIARTQASVESPDALLSNYFAYAVNGTLVALRDSSTAALGSIELKSRFDQPDRIGSRCCSNSGSNSSLCMKEYGVLSITDYGGTKGLATAIDVKFDGSCRHYAGYAGCKASEESAPTFDIVDGMDDLEGLANMLERAGGEARKRQLGLWMRRLKCVRDTIEVRLQSCPENIKRRREGSSNDTSTSTSKVR